MRRILPSSLRALVVLALSPVALAACSGPGQCDVGTDGMTGPCAAHWVSGDGCSGGTVLFPCGLPPSSYNPNGATSPPSDVLCSEYCMGSQAFNACEASTQSGTALGPAFAAQAPTGPVLVRCYQDHTGRRPAALVEGPSPVAGAIGDVLARAAYLEAASVIAFEDLARELQAQGAPRALVRRLRRAAADEVRHARDVTALALAYGSSPPEVRVEEVGARSLLAIALENAREGCVRETWGAACAVVQSMRAADPRVRETMRRVADDELSHSALSWDLARWIESRLTSADRARVERERSCSIAELEAELEHEPPAAWRRALGLPSRDEARAILRGMHAEVWAPATTRAGASA